MYYENNLFSLINLLKCVDEFAVPHFVFSSSCTVYGNPDTIPVTEESPIKKQNLLWCYQANGGGNSWHFGY
jgi:UDP-glucose 4-epimerase